MHAQWKQHGGKVTHLSPLVSYAMTFMAAVMHEKYSLVNTIIFYVIAYLKQKINNKLTNAQ